MRGFQALLWREFKVGLTPLAVLRRVLAPTLYVLVFAVAFTANVGVIRCWGMEVSYAAFLVPGIVAAASFETFSLVFSLVRLDVASRMLDVIMASRAGLTSYLAAKMVFYQLASIATALYVLALGYIVTGRLPSLEGFAVLLLGLALNTALWFSVGFTLGCRILSEDLRDITFMLITFPLMFASPIFYDITVAPAWIRVIAAFNPLTYAVDLMRAGYLGVYPSTLPAEALALAACTAVFTGLAALTAKRLTLK